MAHWIFQEEHEMFRKSLRKFMDKEVLPHIEEWEREGAVPRSLFERFGEMGFLGLILPEEVGGGGADLITEAILYEELGRCGSLGTASSIGYHAAGVIPIIHKFGSVEQKRTYLPAAIRGKTIMALAVSEPHAGSDVAAINTTAERAGNEWVINGCKKFVTNGLQADILCLAVKTDPTKGKEGISIILVGGKSPGISVVNRPGRLGWRSTDLAELKFENVRVPVNQLVGEENKGFEYLDHTASWKRLMYALFAIGLAEKSMQDTILYSKQRKQFGVTINTFQVLQHKMVDMAVEIEKTRNLAYRALFLLQQGQNADIETAMAKAYAGEMVKMVTDSSVQIHGGMGYMMETPVQRYWRDARSLSISGGTTQIMNEVLIRRLGIVEH